MSIVPSRMALLQYKAKLRSANKGHDLLKRKADALKVQFMQVTKQLIELKKDLGNLSKNSFISLAKVNFSTSGDVARILDENVRTKADVKLTLKTKPVAGVTLPQFGIRNMEEEKYGDTHILGITGGGQTMNITKKTFLELLKKMIDIATLQTSYLAIDEALKVTNRRVNALEYIVIPKIEYAIQYIITELDEREKEEKFKIKKILKAKKKHQEIENMLREQGLVKSTGDEEQQFFKNENEEEENEEIEESEKLFG